ncbi:MAG: S-layer homology domain-containing protein [Oscillospiraceae bacterium]|jgi:C1A family cysteine protease|nr:S-layer homology domain-containing protein [Oscillospiraceae bacterium]
MDNTKKITRKLRTLTATLLAAAMALSLLSAASVTAIVAVPAAPEHGLIDGEPAFPVNGVVPEDFTLTYPTYSRSFALRGASSLPAKYDSRDKGIVTAARDQGSNGLCWAFSAYAAVESAIMIAGLTENGSEPDLSEMHMAYATSDTPDGVSGSNPHGFMRTPDFGGNRNFAASYLMRGDGLNGTVNEADMPYSKASGVYYTVSDLEAKPKSYTVQNILYLGDSKESLPVEQLKRAIMQYGVVESGMVYVMTYECFNDSTNAYYYNAAKNGQASSTPHAVALVGWDDDFPVESFVEGNRPQNPGAWLAKNSWGTSNSFVDSQGYFWISYEDDNVPSSPMAIDGVKVFDPAATVYEYDYHGFGTQMSKFAANSNQIISRVAEVFTLNSDNEVLRSIKFFAPAAQSEVDIYVVNNFITPDELDIDDQAGSAVKVIDGASFYYPGWYTLDLETPVMLGEGGSKFAVIAATDNGDFGVDTNINPRPPDGSAYYFIENGSMWIRAGSMKLNIKAVTAAADDAGAIAGAKELLTWDSIRNANFSQSGVTGDLTLTAQIGADVSVAWTSSDASVISTGGAVSRPSDGNKSVTLTAQLTHGGASDTASFDLTVLSANIAASDAIASVKAGLGWDVIKGDNASQNRVVTDLRLPTVCGDVSIVWQSNANSPGAVNGAVTDTGAVTRPNHLNSDRSVRLTANLSLDVNTDTVVIDVTVLRVELTQVQRQQMDVAAVVKWDAIKGENTSQSNVTYDLTLPSVGPYGSTLTWTSENPAISAAGEITRPAAGESDAAGVLRVTPSFPGSSIGSSTATPSLTVPAKTAPTSDDLTFDLTGKIYDGSPQEVSVTASANGFGAITVKYDGSAAAPTDAGTYAVTADIAESADYSPATLSLGNYTISPKSISITGATLAPKTYDGTTSGAVSAVTFSGTALTLGADYTALAEFGSPDAGSALSATVTIVLNNANYELPENTFALSDQTIDKATFDPASITAIVYVYANTPKVFKLADLLPMPGGWTYAVSGSSADEITIDEASSTAITTVTAVKPNYNDVAATINVTVAQKTINENWLAEAPDFNKTYDGISVSYTAVADETASFNPLEAKDAGEYTVTFTKPEDSENVYQPVVITFAISPAPLKITVDDKTITKGESEPAYTYITTGFAAGESWSAAPQLRSSVADTNTVGEYDIVPYDWVLPTPGNYAVTYEAGTLYIRAGSAPTPPSGSGTFSPTPTPTPQPTPTPTPTPAPSEEPDNDTSGSGEATVPEYNISYADVSEDAWYAEDVSYVTANRLMNGVGDGNFSPNTPMTRAMLVTVLYRLSVGDGVLDVPHVDATGFADVPPGEWYSAAIAWAANLSIITGTGDNKFAPNTEITRQDLAVLLYRFAGSPTSTASLSAFADAEAVSDYARDALAWAISTGIIRGDDSGKIDPKASATRADAAAMLRRFIDAAENGA